MFLVDSVSAGWGHNTLGIRPAYAIVYDVRRKESRDKQSSGYHRASRDFYVELIHFVFRGTERRSKNQLLNSARKLSLGITQRGELSFPEKNLNLPYGKQRLKTFRPILGSSVFRNSRKFQLFRSP